MSEEINALRKRAVDEFVAMWTWTPVENTIRLTVDAMREYFVTDEFKTSCVEFYKLAEAKLGVVGHGIVSYSIVISDVVRKDPSGSPDYLFHKVKERVRDLWSEEYKFHILMFAVKVLDWDDSWAQECPMNVAARDAGYTALMDQIVLSTRKERMKRAQSLADLAIAALGRAELEVAQATLVSAFEARLEAMPKPELLILRDNLLANGRVTQQLLGDEVYFRVLRMIGTLC